MTAGLKGPFDIFFRVGSGNEHSLKLRRRKGDPLFHHSLEIPGKHFCIRLFRVFVAGHPHIGEKEADHGADPVDMMRNPCLFGVLFQPFLQTNRPLFQIFVSTPVYPSPCRVAYPAAMARGFPESVPA